MDIDASREAESRFVRSFLASRSPTFIERRHSEVCDQGIEQFLIERFVFLRENHHCAKTREPKIMNVGIVLTKISIRNRPSSVFSHLPDACLQSSTDEVQREPLVENGSTVLCNRAVGEEISLRSNEEATDRNRRRISLREWICGTREKRLRVPLSLDDVT